MHSIPATRASPTHPPTQPTNNPKHKNQTKVSTPAASSCIVAPHPPRVRRRLQLVRDREPAPAVPDVEALEGDEEEPDAAVLVGHLCVDLSGG